MNNLTIIFGLLLTFLAQNLWAEDEISHHHIDRTGQTIYSYENELPIKHNRKSETVGPVEINKIEVVKEVILPFLTDAKSRGYAAIKGGRPPFALCGLS